MLFSLRNRLRSPSVFCRNDLQLGQLENLCSEVCWLFWSMLVFFANTVSRTDD
jgi:hypothetical protein